jgi:hypothetical protein
MYAYASSASKQIHEAAECVEIILQSLRQWVKRLRIKRQLYLHGSVTRLGELLPFGENMFQTTNFYPFVKSSIIQKRNLPGESVAYEERTTFSVT